MTVKKGFNIRILVCTVNKNIKQVPVNLCFLNIFMAVKKGFNVT